MSDQSEEGESESVYSSDEVISLFFHYVVV